jgi:hypothetical protein
VVFIVVIVLVNFSDSARHRSLNICLPTSYFALCLPISQIVLKKFIKHSLDVVHGIGDVFIFNL